MKNRKFRLIVAAVALMGLALSCQNSDEADQKKLEDNLRSSLLEQTELCVIISDQETRFFDKTSEQVVYNSSKTLYMVSNMDNSTHYTLSLDGGLLLNNIINVNYTSSNIDGLDSGTLSMTVLNIDSTDKRYWLWDSELLIGFVVDFDI